VTIYLEIPEQGIRDREDEPSPIRQSAAEVAAHAYSAAVRATAVFVTGLPGPPTHVDLARYTSLLERENAAWQRRREAFAALGLHHQPQAVDDTW